MATLPREEVDHFYELMRGLQLYVNEQRHLVAEAEGLMVEDYGHLPPEMRLQVRDALWAEPELIDSYVEANPQGLSEDDLEIVRRWKGHISGTFFVYRLLKAYAALLGNEGKVYGVLGLYDDWDTLLEDPIYEFSLPIAVKAVLLPYKGKIIYDGLLNIYPVHFGSGYRSDLHEQYMTARQNDQVITSLEPDLAPPPRPRKQAKGLTAQQQQDLETVLRLTEGLRGGPAIQSAALAVLRAGAELAHAAAREDADADALYEKARQVTTPMNRLLRALNRAR